jgi:hypothetical protein
LAIAPTKGDPRMPQPVRAVSGDWTSGRRLDAMRHGFCACCARPG